MVIPHGIMGITMERRCGQYSLTECRCDVGLSVRSFRAFDLRRSLCQLSKIDDRCVDLRRWMIDMPTIEDRWSLCRPSKHR